MHMDDLTAVVLHIGPQELQRRRAKAEKALHEAENLRLQCQGQSAPKIIALQLTVFAPVLETWLSGVPACRTLESQYQTQYYPHHSTRHSTILISSSDLFHNHSLPLPFALQ